MKNEPVIWAVILAAGESRRMKGPKLILPYGQSTIIEHLIDNIRRSEVTGIMVVLGAWKKELKRVIQKLPVSTCVNENYERGMLSSVICGLHSLSEDIDAAMVIPGDQPEITADVADSLIRSMKVTGKGIIVSVHDGKRGHPILIGRKYFNEIDKLDINSGLRALHSKYPEDFLEVETKNIMVLKDIDTREDYFEAISKTQ